jgi:hypothetical protein
MQGVVLDLRGRPDVGGILTTGWENATYKDVAVLGGGTAFEFVGTGATLEDVVAIDSENPMKAAGSRIVNKRPLFVKTHERKKRRNRKKG